MGNWTIESGIEVPAKGRRGGEANPLGEVLAQMKPTQSIRLTSKKDLLYAMYKLKRLNFKVVTMKIGLEEWRVWALSK